MFKIKKCAINTVDDLSVFIKRVKEIIKFKDKRRKKINSTVKLTKEQKRSIDKLYKENYGKKIPYTWHKSFMAHSDKFDEKYFPELLFIPEFEHYMNIYSHYAKTYSDKNVFPILAQKAGIKTPEFVVAIVKGVFVSSDYRDINEQETIEILKDAGSLFVKPSVESSSGKGCFVVEFNNGVDKISGKTVSEIIASLGIDAVFQKKIKCHSSITEIYPESVNTFRVITYRWKNDFCHMPVIMRIGQGGSYLDNAHAGGMFIAIEDDGKMHKKAITEFNDQFYEHPDTHFVFENGNIPFLPEVIKSAKKMHKLIPQIGVVNWDFTIDEDGEPILIEANLLKGSVWLPQMAHGKGPFGDNMVEVLKWLKLMRKTKALERYKWAFGKMPDDEK